MTIQDEGENAKAHDIRCIPFFLPCDCKNETWSIENEGKYPPCEFSEEVPSAYLCVHEYETCMETIEYDSNPDEYSVGWCMPDEKRDECKDETWKELGKYKELNNYGLPIEECPDRDENDDAPEPDNLVEMGKMMN